MKKIQISASIRKPVLDRVAEEAKKEGRHFSEMVDVLLDEATKTRHNDGIKKSK